MNLTPQQEEQLNELERREFNKLKNDKWFCELNAKVRVAVWEKPPFYLYEMHGTGHIATILQYIENKEDAEAPITVEVSIHPEWNRATITEHRIWGVPLDQLKPVMLRSVARMEAVKAEAASSLPLMRRLIDPRNRNEVKKPKWGN